MKEVKIASSGKILATAIGEELIITDRVQAPQGGDLSHWLEFDNEHEARLHFGIFEEKEVGLFG